MLIVILCLLAIVSILVMLSHVHAACDLPQSAELNEDFYNFHEAISHLQEMEEDVVDSHKAYTDVRIYRLPVPLIDCCMTHRFSLLLFFS